MIAKLRSKLSYANVMATIAVFLALAGVAGAASSLLPKNSVTSKAIKNGQVKAADLHRGAVTASKIAPNAVTGAAVKDDSLTGADIDESSLKLNTSPYGTIPSGATVTGSWNYYDLASTPAQVEVVEALPAPAPAPLTDADVSFSPAFGGITEDRDPGCSGDVATPIAPPGKVCIYAAFAQTTPNALVGNGLHTGIKPTPSRYGFEIDSLTAGANGIGDGIWAYTAP